MIVFFRTNEITSDRANANHEHTLDNQIQIRCQVFDFLGKKMDEAADELDRLLKNNDTAVAESEDIMSLIPDKDAATKEQLFELSLRGFMVVYALKKKPRFSWSSVVLTVLGVIQVVCGTLLRVFTASILANLGTALISGGISDCIAAIKSMITKQAVSWGDWIKSKVIGLSVSLLSFGISKYIKEGWQGIKTAFGGMPASEAVTAGVDEAAKQQIKSTLISAGKDFVLQGGMCALECGVLDSNKDKIINMIWTEPVVRSRQSYRRL